MHARYAIDDSSRHHFFFTRARAALPIALLPILLPERQSRWRLRLPPPMPPCQRR